MKLSQLYQQAKRQNIPVISPATQAFLQKVLLKHKPSALLEVGSGIGFSSLWLAHTIAPLNPDALIVSFEISHQSFLKLSSNLSIFDHGWSMIKPYNFDFLKFPLRYLPKFDFVFVDAQKALYHKFLSRIKKVVKPWGVAVFDDVIMFEDKTKAFISAAKRMNLKLEILKLEKNDGVALIQF